MPGRLPIPGDRLWQSLRPGQRGRSGPPPGTQLYIARPSRHPAAHQLSRPHRAGLVTPHKARHPAISPDQDLGAVTEQLSEIPLDFPQRRRWLIGLLMASALLLLYVVSVVAVFAFGVGIWGINAPVF